jgi:hypothetical protein
VTSALAIQQSRAEAVARAIAARLPAGAVHAVFAGGSLGRGEVWAARVGDALEIYSDVDLYVVVDDPARREMVLAAAHDAQSGFAAPPRVALLRGVDVGVYTRRDLLAQPVRPGTADLPVTRVFLHGDRSILAELATALSRTPMSPLESLYLLENRARELCSVASADKAGTRVVAVAALKARIDAGTAHLVAAGAFSPVTATREARLRDAPPPTLPAGDREAVLAAIAASRDLDAYLATADVGAQETLRLLASSWRALAARLYDLPAPGAGMLVAARCGAGQRVENARELWRMRRVAGWSAGRAVAACARLSFLSPRSALRLEPLAAEMVEGEADERMRDFRAHVDALTRALGFASGARTARACDAYARVTGEAR